MTLTVTRGTEIELRDEQGRLIARVYDVYSKTQRDTARPGFMAKEQTAQDLAAALATKFNKKG